MIINVVAILLILGIAYLQMTQGLSSEINSVAVQQ